MKKYVLTGISAIMMAGAAMITTSCDTENDLDVINPNQAALDANWLEKFGDIDPNQNWCFATSAKASVAVYGIDALSDYQLQIYTENPIHSNNALLMASKKVTTDANGNASVNFDAVDVLKGQTMFYACYMDRYYRRAVKPVSLVDGVINAQFGTPGTRAASANSDALVAPDLSLSDVKTAVMAKYSEAKEVTNSNKDQNWDGSPDFATVLKISAGNTWNGNISVLASNSNYGGYGRTLYVDGTWNLNNEGEQKLGTGLIVVGNGGKIIIPQNSQLRTDNGGRIVVLPGGSIEGAGELTFCNGSIAGNEDYIAAGATVNVGKLNNNGGTVFNYGTLQATELIGGAGLSIYVNRNKMIIDHSTLGSSSANTRIYTSCCLQVNGDLCCRNLKLYDPSYVYIKGNLKMSTAEDGTIDPTEILMAKNSHLTVDGGVALNSTSIVGPTDGWAICEFGKIGAPGVETNFTPAWINGQEQITDGCVKNNLYISIDQTEQITNYWNLSPYGKFVMNMLNGRLFDVNTTWNQATQQNDVTVHYREGVQAGNGNAVIVEKGKAPIYIPAGDCGVPEYQGLNGAPSTPQPQNFIIACEDLGSTLDVDFNDVVFSVGHVTGEKSISITALAAGGTLEANVYYNDIKIGEIHEMLGVGDHSQMLNTSADGITKTGSTITIDVDDENWKFEDNFNNFSIRVTGNDQTSRFIKAPKTGNAPFMIAVPSTWEWPREFVNIEKAYPGFSTWSQDANSTSWSLAPEPSLVISRSNNQ